MGHGPRIAVAPLSLSSAPVAALEHRAPPSVQHCPGTWLTTNSGAREYRRRAFGASAFTAHVQGSPDNDTRMRASIILLSVQIMRHRDGHLLTSCLIYSIIVAIQM